MGSLGRYTVLSWSILVIFFADISISAQQFTYNDASLIDIIVEIEQETEYRFLYREALISSIKLSFNGDFDDLITIIESTLMLNNLGLKLDDERFQALIYNSGSVQKTVEVKISGFILDDITGERLPYATISWYENGELVGINSSENGSYSLNTIIDTDKLSLVASFVGYNSKQIELDLSNQNNWEQIAFRLTPKPFSGKEIIVKGVNFYTPNDTVLNGLIKVGAFSPLGESNAVRSLQMLPAVSMNAAVNDGINIRGSSSDGFQVLLDGQTVYNQSHLFGMLDAMNADVLKSSGFYYDVTPAQYQAPLGGTLSLITRTGSLNDIKGSVGLSNTAIKSTLEGPIKKGSASWLLSGRLSYLDEIDWFNNSKMIEYGLDVSRPAEIQPDPRLDNIFVRDVQFNEIDVQSTSAQFYDLHGKLYAETKNGNQFSLSGYIGFDEANQEYLRDEQPIITQNETNNFWKNASINANYVALLPGNFLSDTRIGYSAYNSEYFKSDFEFPVNIENDNVRPDSVAVQPLNLENDVYQFDLKQTFSTEVENGKMEFGLSYSDFDVQYLELGLVRESFLSRRTSQLFDLFHQYDLEVNDDTFLSIGNRVHYFSNGNYLRWSPRFKISYYPETDLSIGFGFSRNYQFINRLEFYNINSNDFWILTNEDQPPSSVNYFTGGVYYNISEQFYVQAEVYVKDFQNLRLHELTTGAISSSFQNNPNPWFYQNDGFSKGIELLSKNRFKDVQLSFGYTWSTSELKNERINNGEYFYANWDRRHQISASSEIDLDGGFTLLTAWTYGSGIPDRADFIDPEGQTNRLPNYSRVDFALNFKKEFRTGLFEAKFSLYNAFDRDNPWYSERKQITVTTRNNVLQGNAITNVLDLGFQPSFSIGFYF